MQELGVKAVLPPEVQGHTLTAFNLPDGVTYAQLHDGLKQEGYIIYAGQAQLEDKIFRVANIGALTNQNIDGFLSAFQVTLEKARA
jgi:2-aminoethylphosphonate-pyruvate transaminase